MVLGPAREILTFLLKKWEIRALAPKTTGGTKRPFVDFQDFAKFRARSANSHEIVGIPQQTTGGTKLPFMAFQDSQLSQAKMQGNSPIQEITPSWPRVPLGDMEIHGIPCFSWLLSKSVGITSGTTTKSNLHTCAHMFIHMFIHMLIHMFIYMTYMICVHMCINMCINMHA